MMMMMKMITHKHLISFCCMTYLIRMAHLYHYTMKPSWLISMQTFKSMQISVIHLIGSAPRPKVFDPQATDTTSPLYSEDFNHSKVQVVSETTIHKIQWKLFHINIM